MTATVMVAIPTAGHPHPDAIDSILRAAAEYGAPLCWSQIAPRDVNRNRIAQRFLDDGHDWLCMIDDDQVVPEGAIKKLVDVGEQNGGAVVIAPTPILMDERLLVNVALHGVTPRRWPSLHAWDTSRPPFRVSVGGTGMVLIRRDVFTRLEFPWFTERYGDARGSGAQTEDVIFCERVDAAGMEIWCHPAVLCGHMKCVNLLRVCTARELELGHFVRNKEAARDGSR